MTEGIASVKPYVVFVPQIVVGGFKPFEFDIRVLAEAFAEETNGILYSRAMQTKER